uniref:Uncharacterized protein n=1 Tax=Podoviridae sp. ctnCN2 TaxID=2825274 RepID=A0A8S5PMW1_9CAUD|nr:MAG TPA: hypothetical protein [Podoviridae sp. ctnCN2]
MAGVGVIPIARSDASTSHRVNSTGGGASSGTTGERAVWAAEGVEAEREAGVVWAGVVADLNALAACSLRFSGLERADVVVCEDTEKISHTLNGLWEIVTEIVWGRQPQGMGVLQRLALSQAAAGVGDCKEGFGLMEGLR